jgi:perosamine synthetase
MQDNSWPQITDQTKKAVMAQLEKGEISIYGAGGIFEKFERDFGQTVNRLYTLVVSSGTAAMHSAMIAAGLGPDDEVICPAYTFFASVTPVFQTGAVPVLCDAGPDGNIDPAQITKHITPRTKAVIITHMWGMPCNISAILAICRQNNLLLIEDCAHAHGALYKGRPVGSQSDIAIWSIQGQKIITGGEGGVLATNNQDLYERALLFGHYNKRSLQEIRPDSPYFDYAETGFGLKLRAHPFAIAMASEQFSHLPEWHAAKHENAVYLGQKLADYPELELPVTQNAGDEPAWYAYVFRIKPKALRISAGEFCRKLHSTGIINIASAGATRPLNQYKLFQSPAFLFPYYKNKVAYKPGDFPVAESFSARMIKVPVAAQHTADQRERLDGLADTIGKLLQRYRA